MNVIKKLNYIDHLVSILIKLNDGDEIQVIGVQYCLFFKVRYMKT